MSSDVVNCAWCVGASVFLFSLLQIIGGLIALICVGCVIYSEVNAMLLTRDLDALKAAELLEVRCPKICVMRHYLPQRQKNESCGLCCSLLRRVNNILERTNYECTNYESIRKLSHYESTRRRPRRSNCRRATIGGATARTTTAALRHLRTCSRAARSRRRYAVYLLY